MNRCPICGDSDSWDIRTFLIALMFGLIVGFVGGQFFYAYQVKPLFQDKNEKLEERNEELRKHYNPPSFKK